jgi:hypothetical protein
MGAAQMCSASWISGVASSAAGFHQLASANWLRWLPQKNPAKPNRDFLSIGNIDVSSSGFR